MQEELDCKLEEFNEQLILSKKIIVKIEDETYNLLNPCSDDFTEFKQMFQDLTHHPPKSVRVLNFFSLSLHYY